ncbi:unnamed protein product [Caenorhabditis auriculariae]|uniref:Probable inactive acireductone dioxygenase n=1 Tax=Caenorhabditis auriculariae TaxID=2777116 RepID=A0A8S1H978_9PELO|nr:unnamed protein product [Caenorhabditis auriculariae]
MDNCNRRLQLQILIFPASRRVSRRPIAIGRGLTSLLPVFRTAHAASRFGSPSCAEKAPQNPSSRAFCLVSRLSFGVMQIWCMEPYPCGDRRLPHHVFPPKKLSPDQLAQKTGVQYFKVDLDDTVAMKKRLSRVKAERNVSSSDVFTISESIADFNDKLEEFYEPQQRADDVVSLVIDGSCYYDVEPEEDEWIRVQLERGDLLVIPKGLSHRFTTTPKNFVQMQRFFSKKPDTQG